MSVVIRPPSPTSIDAKLEQISSRRRLPPQIRPHGRITHFLLAPHSTPHAPQPNTSSFFERALSAFRNSSPSHSSSFTLCPLPQDSQMQTNIIPPVPSQGSCSASGLVPLSVNDHHHLPHLPPRPSPFLTFHDRTPMLTVRSITGLLEIDQTEEMSMGVQTSFWVAVALTYLEFLEERDVSIKSPPSWLLFL